MVNTTRKTKISVDQIEKVDAFEMRKSDWKRIRKNINSINEPSKLLSNIYFALFGAAISGIVGLIPLFNYQTIPSWVIPVYCSTIIFLGILGFVIFLIDKRDKNNLETKLKNIVTEMDDIKKI